VKGEQLRMSKNNSKVNEIKDAVERKLSHSFGTSLEEATREELYKAGAGCIRDEIMQKWSKSRKKIEDSGAKKLYYMSAEFLMGRAFSNNLINAGVFEDYKTAFKEMGFDLEEIGKEEPDAGLGNGGLGRLAACFLDSLATLDLPVIGCGIRYEYGLFKQKIIDGTQIEIEDDWLREGHVWEIERPELSVEVKFNGTVEQEWAEDGLKIHHKDYHTVIAVPYDVPIIGYQSNTPATLRLWSARSKQTFDLHYFNEGMYNKSMADQEFAEVISKVLYPADDHMQGKMLRLKQFYFLTSATMQLAVRSHKEKRGDLHTLADHAVVQINDTHPTLAIPELMRILMDEEGFGWDEAYDIVSQMFNYTNHTIMQEALECWDENMFKLLLPRIYQIICTLNEKYCNTLRTYYPNDEGKIAYMSIIGNSQIRMANLCIAVCRRVNGVSQLHGDIIKNQLFHDSYNIYPQKYLAITNGITHRRWFALSNPGLYRLVSENIEGDVLKDYKLFDKITPLANNPEFCKAYDTVKMENKKRLAKYLKEEQGIEINPNSIIDVQCKRLHEYKRQLLKCLHIIYLYKEIKRNPDFITTPITFIFGAKAAPGYTRAKDIIRLINSIGEMVNNDPEIKQKIQVVFVENYSVSVAEVLIPAADISEQLSTAGLEASGTGNMKFMMNGALTLGTMDGANVEIYEQVGKDNIFIFGATVDEINSMKQYKTYNPGNVFEQSPIIRDVCNCLISGDLPKYGKRKYSDIYQSLLFGDFGTADQYFVLYDLPSYIEEYRKVYKTYTEKHDQWVKMAVLNTAKSGFFSSDRTIAEYNDKIWHLKRNK
jgi:starch phosphorylase